MIRAWQPETMQQELAKCQRFYCKTFDIDVQPTQGSNNFFGCLGAMGTANGTWSSWRYPVLMCTERPAISTYNPVSVNVFWRNEANNADSSDVQVSDRGQQGAIIATFDTSGKDWDIHASAEGGY